MRNSFVYESIKQLALAEPDIEVLAQRHFAQCAEDIIVVALLKSIAHQLGIDLSGEQYLEIGANHPIATSATYLMNVELGMRGVLVEANPALIDQLKTARPHDLIVNKAIVASDAKTIELFVSNQSEISSLSREFVEDWQGGAVGLNKVETVPACRVNDLLRENFKKKAPIFLSIDIEGLDLDILQDLDWTKWRPAIVQAEPSEHFIEANSKMISDFMTSIGYFEIAKTSVNQIFADSYLLSGPHLSEKRAQAKKSFIPTPGKPSVGVVMRTKDRAVLLRRALESVRDQTYENWRLIVVNDGGDPEPVDWLVRHILKDDQRVCVLHHPKSKGMVAASNAGLAVLETDYALIHDDDDSLAPEFMAAMTAAIEHQRRRFPSLKGIVCRTNVVYETVVGNEVIIEKVEPFALSRAERLDEGFLSVQRMLVRNQFAPIAFLFDLSAAREVGLIEDTPTVTGDWGFNIRFMLKNDIWIQPEFLSFQHQRVTSPSNAANAAHANAADHRLYQQKVRNDSVRNIVGADGHGRMALVLPTELGELFETEFREVRKSLSKLELKLTPKPPVRPLWRRILSRLKRDALRAKGGLLRRLRHLKGGTAKRRK